MSVNKYLQTAPLHSIAPYNKHIDPGDDAIPFVGAPRAHPYDREKLILITRPFTENTEFFEFRMEDILKVDESSSIATDTGRNIGMVKVWIRKGSLGLRYQPFEVDKPLRYYRDSEILREAFSSAG